MELRGASGPGSNMRRKCKAIISRTGQAGDEKYMKTKGNVILSPSDEDARLPLSFVEKNDA